MKNVIITLALAVSLYGQAPVSAPNVGGSGGSVTGGITGLTGDVNAVGSGSVLSIVQTAGNNTTIFNQGNLATPTLAQPTTHGVAGTTSYEYCAAFQVATGTGICSSTKTLTTGNAVLDTSNYNVIAAPACSDPNTSVNIYLVTGGGNAPDAGYLANVACGATYNHQGVDGNGATIPVADSSSGIYAPNSIAVGNTFNIGNYIRQNSTYNNSYAPVGTIETVYTAAPNSAGSATNTLNVISSNVSDDSLYQTFGAINIAQQLGTSPNSHFFNLNAAQNFAVVGSYLEVSSITPHAADGTNVSATATSSLAGAMNLGSSTMPAAYSNYLSVDNLSHYWGETGRITNGYLSYYHSGSHTGIDNVYGIYMENFATGATNYWAIKTGTGRIEFGDHVDIDGKTLEEINALTIPNGGQIYCSDCTVTSPVDNTCAGSGTGAYVFKIAGALKCMI